MKIVNAKIESTSIGIMDRGPSFWLHLDYGGSAQGFGGYALGGDFTHYVLIGILEAVKVDLWENLPGTPVRAFIDEETDTVVGIGHYLGDTLFYPRDYEKA